MPKAPKPPAKPKPDKASKPAKTPKPTESSRTRTHAKRPVLSGEVIPGPAKVHSQAHDPTQALRNLVMACRGGGMTHEQIANAMQVSVDTLEKHYRDELDNGMDRIGAQLTGKMMKLALDGDREALKFVLARRFGWSEKTDPMTLRAGVQIDGNGEEGGGATFVVELQMGDKTVTGEASG